jgi:hypothetical protein
MNNNLEPMPTQNPWAWVGLGMGMGMGTQCRALMDRHLYKFILEIFMWSTIHNYNMDPSRLVFQHDDDSKHTSKIVQEWLASKPF